MTVIDYRSAPDPNAPKTRERRIFCGGIILVCIGGVCAFFALSLLLMLLLGPKGALYNPGVFFTPAPTRGSSTSTSTFFVTLVIFLVYGALAAAFIWTGSAAVRFRRWSRPVILAAAGCVLFAGLVFHAQALAEYLLDLFLSTTPRPTNPVRAVGAAARGGIDPARNLIAGFVVLAFLTLALPGLFLWLFRGRAVEETFDRADPLLAWTDRIPIPALALALALAYVALSLGLPAAIAPSVVVFGWPVTGGWATLVYLAVAFAFAANAFLAFRLASVTPWLALALIALVVSSIAWSTYNAPLPTAPRGGFAYGYQQPERNDLLLAKSLTNLILFILPATLYVLHVRHHFTRPAVTGRTRMPGRPSDA
jgi:hypothetical protein